MQHHTIYKAKNLNSAAALEANLLTGLNKDLTHCWVYHCFTVTVISRLECFQSKHFVQLIITPDFSMVMNCIFSIDRVCCLDGRLYLISYKQLSYLQLVR